MARLLCTRTQYLEECPGGLQKWQPVHRDAQAEDGKGQVAGDVSLDNDGRVPTELCKRRGRVLDGA